jgi:hypothetical protein
MVNGAFPRVNEQSCVLRFSDPDLDRNPDIAEHGSRSSPVGGGHFSLSKGMSKNSCPLNNNVLPINKEPHQCKKNIDKKLGL